jgi:type I restriction enzyme, S subunit
MEISLVKFGDIKANSKILKPNYHLNYGKIRIATAKINNAPFIPLGKVVKEIYTGGIFKRIFVDDINHGVKYISAQHMMDINPLDIAKLISKKYTPRQDDMTLEEGQILVSCAGTVGNVRLINRLLNGIIGSQDIIRILSNNSKLPFGYLYSYLTSPTAYNFIQSYIYGSVVPRIEPNTLSELPIFIADKKIINSVHEKILQSFELRSKGIESLTSAIGLLESYLPDFIVPSVYSTKISDLKKGKSRLDSTFSNIALAQFHTVLEKKGYETFLIKDITKKVFTPNIFKRIKTEKNENSVPYLGGAELLEIHPKFNTYLSRRTKNIQDYILKKGWIAIQDSGSLQSMGYVSLIPSYLENIAATNNLVRVIPNSEKNYNYYLFAFLKSKQGNNLLKSYSYGTGQLHIDNSIIENMKVPIISEIFDSISTMVDEYLRCIEEGYNLEADAIEIIENQISLWQK